MLQNGAHLNNLKQNLLIDLKILDSFVIFIIESVELRFFLHKQSLFIFILGFEHLLHSCFC